MDKIKETIKQLEEMKEHFKSVQDIDECADHVGHIKAIDTVVEVLESLKQGEWIPDDYEYNHCSECGYEHDSSEYVTPYCPNCGAKMEEE